MRSLFLLYFTLEASVAIVSPYVQIILRNKGYSQGLTGVVLAIGEIATTIVPLLVCNYADRSGKTRFLLFLCSFISAFLFIPICTGNSLFLVVLCYFLAQGLFGSLNSLADGFSNRCLEGNNGKYGAIRAFGSFGYVICLIFF
ncbi:MAG: MFS transporter, partial [Sphaerochaetaceae bacterium]|nr:MFS transporter [Sphaerochaetaceae bacterium]